jgi:predicted membrane channel-forming protein YqfA (hemolysin III family)
VESNQSKKGVKTKLFGVVLIVLGTLDSMLSWRGGFALSDLYVVLIACGVFLYAIGAIRHGSRAIDVQR